MKVSEMDSNAEPDMTVIIYTAEIRGGSARYICEAAIAASAADQKIVLICPPNFEFMQQLTSSGRVQIELTAAKTTKLNSSPLFKVGEYMHICWKAGCALRRYARNSGRRVVHFNHPGRLMFVVPLMLLAHRLRMGVIFTVHDPIPHKEPDRWLEARLERFLMLAACRVADRLIAGLPSPVQQVCSHPARRFRNPVRTGTSLQSAPTTEDSSIWNAAGE
jgi:hypothetical protein